MRSEIGPVYYTELQLLIKLAAVFPGNDVVLCAVRHSSLEDPDNHLGIDPPV